MRPRIFVLRHLSVALFCTTQLVLTVMIVCVRLRLGGGGGARYALSTSPCFP